MYTESQCKIYFLSWITLKSESDSGREIQQGPHQCYAPGVWGARLGLLLPCGELEGMCPLADLALSMILRENEIGRWGFRFSNLSPVGFFLFIKVIHDKRSCQISGPRKKIGMEEWDGAPGLKGKVAMGRWAYSRSLLIQSGCGGEGGGSQTLEREVFILAYLSRGR